MTAGVLEPPKPHQLSTSSLDLKGVAVRFAALRALEEITFSLPIGRVTGLIGPNGAGKTTAVNVLTGFQRPTTGQVLLGGEDLTDLQPEQFARRGIMRTFQSGRLFGRLATIDNVAASAIGVSRLSRRAARERAYDILEWLGCARLANQFANGLPHGFQQRVGIARALAGSPKFVLLDEPASGLGRADCDDLIGLIKEIPRQFGCGVLLIEHNMSVIMNACSSIMVLGFGKKIAEGTPQEITANREVRRAYLGSADDSAIAI